jgi:hypothetical protein
VDAESIEELAPSLPKQRPAIRPLDRLKRSLFVVYVATDMMLCALFFSWWALPRETISGFLGRTSFVSKPGPRRRLAELGRFLVDRVYFWEEDHCAMVYREECDARRALYGDRHD